MPRKMITIICSLYGIKNLIDVCEIYVNEFNIKFNWSKSHLLCLTVGTVRFQQEDLLLIAWMLGIVSLVRICCMYVQNLIAILLNYILSKQKYDESNVWL